MRFSKFVPVASTLLKLSGLYGRGVRNALDIRLTEQEIAFAELPKAYDGYRILHLSDLHLDFIGETTERLLQQLEHTSADLCLLSGDYRLGINGKFRQILEPMRRVRDALNTADGCFAILGNHDCTGMIEPFEEMGIRVLRDQSVELNRDGTSITLSGFDGLYVGHRHLEGPKHFVEPKSAFSIALTHAPDLVEPVMRRGYSLYLAGHTHGGQICWPGGRPILANVDARRTFLKGLWQSGGMRGFTNSGVSVSSLPVRFNTRGEVVIITLRRDDDLSDRLQA